jgi:GNAT superfamily N-acetyltransferase
LSIVLLANPSTRVERKTVNYRQAAVSDIPAMARMRAAEWESVDYWETRIAGYMAGSVHPHDALMPRVVYVAVDGDALVGFAAGHLTRRYACDGELEWIHVAQDRRRSGVASELLAVLARWFLTQKALRVCVDPGSLAARSFYARHGAKNLNQHWMVWENVGAALSRRTL